MRIVVLALVVLAACKSGADEKGKTVEPTTGSGTAVGSGSAPAPPSYAVDLAGYDLTCKTDADCTVVHIYPCDTRCGCPQHVIAVKEMAKFNAAAAAIACPKQDVTYEQVQCGSCMSPVPACEAGTCVTKPAK